MVIELMNSLVTVESVALSLALLIQVIRGSWLN